MTKQTTFKRETVKQFSRPLTLEPNVSAIGEFIRTDTVPAEKSPNNTEYLIHIFESETGEFFHVTGKYFDDIDFQVGNYYEINFVGQMTTKKGNRFNAYNIFKLIAEK